MLEQRNLSDVAKEEGVHTSGSIISRYVNASSSVEMTRQPSYADKVTDRQMYCCSVRDMWRTTDSRRIGWESQAELNRLIWNQQENERPAVGGKPRQSPPIPPVAIESAVTPFTVARDGRNRQPYPLSLMSNSTKAGEDETLCGLKVRGDVIETRLMIWWTGIAVPTEDSLRAEDCNKLKVRFSVFTEDPDEASVSVL